MTVSADPASEALLQAAYARILQDRSEGLDLSPADQFLYELEMLGQEVTGGASFEQYFRWAGLDEIARAPARLEELGLAALARLVRQAVAVAFPGGLPASEAEMDELAGWTPEQAAELALLADEFGESRGLLCNTLAGWYQRATTG